MESLNLKNENIERKFFKNMQKNQFLKVENSLLELVKNFIELEERELNSRDVKVKIQIEELFFKPIMVSLDTMNNFEQKEIKKIRPIKNTWYDWLIGYILSLQEKCR